MEMEGNFSEMIASMSSASDPFWAAGMLPPPSCCLLPCPRAASTKTKMMIQKTPCIIFGRCWFGAWRQPSTTSSQKWTIWARIGPLAPGGPRWQDILSAQLGIEDWWIHGQWIPSQWCKHGANVLELCCEQIKPPLQWFQTHCFLEGNSCGPQGHITNWAFGVSSASCVWPDIQIWYPSCPWGRIGSPLHCQCSLGHEITWSWHSGGEVEEPSEQNSTVLWRAGHWVWAPSQKVPYVRFLLSQKQVGHFPIPQWHQGQAMQVAGSSVPPDLWGQSGNRWIFTAQVQMLQTFEHCVWGDGFCWDAPQPNWCQNFLQGHEQLPATLQQAFSSLPPARCINVEYHSENAPLPALGAPIQVVQSKILFLLLWWNNGGPYVCLGACLPQWHHSPFSSTQNSLEI